MLLARHVAVARSAAGGRRLRPVADRPSLRGVLRSGMLRWSVSTSPHASRSDRWPRTRREKLASVRAAGADALVYLGLGLVGTAVARAPHRRGVGCTRGDEHRRVCAATTPSTRVRSTAGSTSTWSPTTIRCSPASATASVRTPPPGLFAAVGYDLGLLVAEGLARAPELTAEGVRDGLELVKLRAGGRGPRRHDVGLRPLGPRRAPRSLPRAPTVARRHVVRGRHLVAQFRAREPGPSGKNNYWKYVASGVTAELAGEHPDRLGARRRRRQRGVMLRTKSPARSKSRSSWVRSIGTYRRPGRWHLRTVTARVAHATRTKTARSAPGREPAGNQGAAGVVLVPDPPTRSSRRVSEEGHTHMPVVLDDTPRPTPACEPRCPTRRSTRGDRTRRDPGVGPSSPSASPPSRQRALDARGARPRGGAVPRRRAVTGILNIGNPFATTTIDRSPPAVLKQLTNLSTYSAAQGRYEQTIDVEDDVSILPSFLAGEHTVFLAQGSVDARVDFSGSGDGRGAGARRQGGHA